MIYILCVYQKAKNSAVICELLDDMVDNLLMIYIKLSYPCDWSKKQPPIIVRAGEDNNDVSTS